MNRLYRQYRVALRDRDALALRRLIAAHPELHSSRIPDSHGHGVVWSIAQRAPDMLEEAFKAGLSPDADPDEHPGQTLLQHAAANGDEKMVGLLVRFGAALERRNEQGETALGYACAYGHFGVVRLLVEAGADVNAVEADPEVGLSWTALDSCRDKPQIAACLRAHGAKTWEELKAER
jgi:ankyrin repeat protein